MSCGWVWMEPPGFSYNGHGKGGKGGKGGPADTGNSQHYGKGAGKKGAYSKGALHGKGQGKAPSGRWWPCLNPACIRVHANHNGHSANAGSHWMNPPSAEICKFCYVTWRAG